MYLAFLQLAQVFSTNVKTLDVLQEIHLHFNVKLKTKLQVPRESQMLPRHCMVDARGPFNPENEFDLKKTNKKKTKKRHM